MSFFKKHPRFWIAIWGVFGFGGLAMIAEAALGPGMNLALIFKGLVGVAVAGMMIRYLVPELRKQNAQN